jgi:ABC-type multidrug transport system ATPase subunit
METEGPSSASEPAFLAALQGVSVRYGPTRALVEVDLEILPGLVYAVVGAPGSGKSSLLKLLSGRLVPAAGALRFGAALGLFDSARARSIGYAAQAPELDPEMTVREHLTLFAALSKIPSATRQARIEEVSRTLALPPSLDQRIDACSAGARQRLHLALSVLHGPRLWLLDEPFAALESDAQDALWAALAAHAKAGGTCLVVCQNFERLASFADRILVLDAGRLMANAPPSPLALAHGNLAAAYEALTGHSASELWTKLAPT